MNSKQDMQAAKGLIEAIQRGHFQKEAILEDFFQAEVLYQDGVRKYNLKQYQEARKVLKRHLELQPQHYWTYYILWKVEKDLGVVNESAPQKAIIFAKKWGNKVFLDMMEEEYHP